MGLCAGQDAAFQAGILANITIKQKNRTKYYKGGLGWNTGGNY